MGRVVRTKDLPNVLDNVGSSSLTHVVLLVIVLMLRRGFLLIWTLIFFLVPWWPLIQVSYFEACIQGLPPCPTSS
ncbi:Hypothetical protein FKW44_022703 [Caligus rogercresseyi]|uniref:Uncharacterized protein n=1 Tax=Caligus rogercresseyi TaxID=217165 RepID=A0A7T8JUL6_CALRO|nr:Hypothetical protein FKW44_022703 [Caligus rogercresseyi]